VTEIREFQTDHVESPLPLALSDGTHGIIRRVALITVRLRDAAGGQGEHVDRHGADHLVA
jgi:hypothetical protein